MRPGACGRDAPLPIFLVMSKLGMIGATLVAALCALGLSVGAALAESPGSATPKFDANGKPVPTGVCFLHKIVP